MRILAIDTSLGSGSVAAADDDGTEERPLGAAGEHARVLTSALLDVAGRRGWPSGGAPLVGPDDVVAVVRGPGSFTGLRVGVTAGKALAWTTGARLVAVSGFAVIASRRAGPRGWADAPIVVAYDAGRGDVYAATVTQDANDPTGWRIETPALTTIDDWLRTLPAGGRVAGPALAIHGGRAGDRGDLAIAPREAWLPTAVEAAALARARALAGGRDDPHTLLPEYLRPSYAEERRA